jgi:hypothetical protein
MPYKDPNRKKEWEQLNHVRRLARRRELRRIRETQSTDPLIRQSSQGVATLPLPWLVLAAGSSLALYSPPMGVGAGVLTLAVAVYRDKGWQWKAVGAVILLISLFLLWNDWDTSKKTDPASTVT